MGGGQVGWQEMLFFCLLASDAVVVEKKTKKGKKKVRTRHLEKKTVVCFFRLLVLFETELFGR